MSKIIIQEDYRKFSYPTEAMSAEQHLEIRKLLPLLHTYFHSRPFLANQVEFASQIDPFTQIKSKYARGPSYTRIYITFKNLADARMFILNFAEYIDTQGYKYD